MPSGPQETSRRRGDALEKAAFFGKEARDPEFPDSSVYRDIPVGNLGGLLLALGEDAAALSLLSELLERERARGLRHGTGVFRNYILAAQRLGHAAEPLWRGFLDEALPADNYFGVLEALEALARIAAESGPSERAERLFSAAEAFRRRVGSAESAEIVRRALSG